MTAATCLTACNSGDADQNVVRDLFAVGEVIDVTEDDGPIAGDVSKNDFGEGLTYALADGSAVVNGTLVFNVDGRFTYTPAANFFGTDSVSYVVTHTATGKTNTALLTIKVENDFELIEEYGWGLIWSDEFDTVNLFLNIHGYGAYTGRNHFHQDKQCLFPLFYSPLFITRFL